jgi:hypothetical protein
MAGDYHFIDLQIGKVKGRVVRTPDDTVDLDEDHGNVDYRLGLGEFSYRTSEERCEPLGRISKHLVVGP